MGLKHGLLLQGIHVFEEKVLEKIFVHKKTEVSGKFMQFS
jgi:hypothetical protein